MSPKEKAEELVKRYSRFELNKLFRSGNTDFTKQISINSVDEIIYSLSHNIYKSNNKENEIIFWQQVKQELNKL